MSEEAEVHTPDTKVGVVGLGAMDGRIARRLLNGGHCVTVWNRTSRKTTPLSKAGAHVAETPAAVARDCDVVITDGFRARRAARRGAGPGWIASNLGSSGVWVEMSTLGPAAILDLASTLDDDSRLVNTSGSSTSGREPR